MHIRRVDAVVEGDLMAEAHGRNETDDTMLDGWK